MQYDKRLNHLRECPVAVAMKDGRIFRGELFEVYTDRLALTREDTGVVWVVELDDVEDVKIMTQTFV